MTREAYVAECEQRWHGPALRDARSNWQDFEELRDTLLEAMREYKRNPGQKDLSGKYHNPDTTLTSFLWKLQETLQPDKSCLYPLIDFEENYQRCFLRRGLIIYCSGLLREIETPKHDPNQFDLTL